MIDLWIEDRLMVEAVTPDLAPVLETGGLFDGDNVKVTLHIVEGVCEQEKDAEWNPTKETVAEADIRQRVEDYAKAISAKDIDAVMSFFAPDLVSFDIAIDTLRYVGADSKRREWQKAFAAYSSIAYDVRDLNVTMDGELALVHAVNHVKGTLASGEVTDLWVRWTACFRQIDGIWLIVHDHVSVPADFENGQAVLNLRP